MAGLGEQKITFDKGGKASHVHAKITEAFPALNEGGGYEILRMAEGRSKFFYVLYTGGKQRGNCTMYHVPFPYQQEEGCARPVAGWVANTRAPRWNAEEPAAFWKSVHP